MGLFSFMGVISFTKKVIAAILTLTLTSCAVLDFPDKTHEEIYNQVDDQMSQDIEFGRR